MACTRSSPRKRIRTLPVLLALLLLAGACSGDNGSPDSTVAAPTTTAPPPTTTSTTLPPTTTTAAPTTTTTSPATTTVPSDEEPEITARITDPEDPDQIMAAVEEFFVWYQWWLAHPEESFDHVIEEGSVAHNLIVERQDELLSESQFMRDGLSVVELFDHTLLPNDLISLRIEVRRDGPRERVDAETGDVVVVEREATGETAFQSWLLVPQADGSHKVGDWGPVPFQDI